jgi:hypothetical protein
MVEITRPIFNDIMEYCKKNKMEFEDFLCSVPDMISRAWAADENVQEWYQQVLTPDAKPERYGRSWFYKDQDPQELATQAVELLSKNFITCWVGDRWQSYKIQDLERKLVVPIVTDDGLRTVQKIIKDELWEDNCAINTVKMHTLWDYFQTHADDTAEAPKPLAQMDEDCWAFDRIKTRPDPSVPFPHIQQFLSLVDDPEAFAAWHYGVHSGRLKRGRQILWLEGPGENGKSIWLDTFAKEFGKSVASMTASAIKEPKFLNALIENRHFAYIPDCKNSYILLTEGFQNMSSGGFDLVPIEHKYGKITMGHISAKWAIASNYKPHIINESFNTSRTFWLSMKPFTGEKDPSIGDKWSAEMAGFLAYGEKCYAERCVNDYEIKVNEIVAAKKAARISDASEEHDVTLDINFVIDPMAKLSPSEMSTKLQEYGLRDTTKQKNFHEYLEKEHGVKKSGKPLTYKGIRLRGPGDDAKAAQDELSDVEGPLV